MHPSGSHAETTVRCTLQLYSGHLCAAATPTIEEVLQQVCEQHNTTGGLRPAIPGHRHPELDQERSAGTWR